MLWFLILSASHSHNCGVNIQYLIFHADLLAYGSRRNPIAKSFGLQVVTALQLGHKRQASDLLSEADVADHALNAEDIIYILEYCARTPDPLVGVAIFYTIEYLQGILFGWFCFATIEKLVRIRCLDSFWSYVTRTLHFRLLTCVCYGRYGYFYPDTCPVRRIAHGYDTVSRFLSPLKLQSTNPFKNMRHACRV